jgi:rod shape determining protein RodA
LRQPDLGTSLLVAASGLFGIFMAGIGWRFIIGAALAALLSAWPAWMFCSGLPEAAYSDDAES